MNAKEINEALAMLATLDAIQIRVAAAALVSPKHFDEYFTPETANVEYLRSMLEDAITERDITAAQLNEAASRRPRIFKPSHAENPDALYRVTATASGIYSDFTDRHIAEKELQNLINNGKAATLIEIAQ